MKLVFSRSFSSSMVWQSIFHVTIRHTNLIALSVRVWRELLSFLHVPVHFLLWWFALSSSHFSLSFTTAYGARIGGTVCRVCSLDELLFELFITSVIVFILERVISCITSTWTWRTQCLFYQCNAMQSNAMGSIQLKTSIATTDWPAYKLP